MKQSKKVVKHWDDLHDKLYEASDCFGNAGRFALKARMALKRAVEIQHVIGRELLARRHLDID